MKKPIYEKIYFWLIVFGIIFIIISIILGFTEPTITTWFWIIFSLGSSAVSIGVYWYISESFERRRNETTKKAILEAAQIGAQTALTTR